MRSKDRTFKPRNLYGFTGQMESSQQRHMRLQDTSARKAICSQLETLERGLEFIILFFNLFTVVFFMEVDIISSHC